MADMGREIAGSKMQALGKALQAGNEQDFIKALAGAHKLGQDGQDSEFARSYARTMQRCNVLHATLHWHLGERLDLHEWKLGIRAGGRIVKLERRT
jgi:hypothetical protein